MVQRRKALREGSAPRAKVLRGPLNSAAYDVARALFQGKAFDVVVPCTCAACARDGQHAPFCPAHDGDDCDCGGVQRS